MIHFVLGWRPDGGLDVARAAAALRELTGRLGFLDPAGVRTWRSPSAHAGLAWVAHDPSRLGGVEHVHTETDRMAVFAGRPVRWRDSDEADGRGPLDPRAYLPPSAAWREALDGRWAAARYDEAERELEVGADALGAYPLFEAVGAGVRWFSNAPGALAALIAARELDALALAGALGGGWSLAGDPLWRDVLRLPRGAFVRLHADGAEERAELLPEAEIAAMLGAGMDAGAAAGILTAGVGALADWPGRPSVVPVTGGRDSRLVLAAALRAGIEFTTATGGEPASADVVRGAELAAAAGAAHARLGRDPHGDRESATERAAEVLADLCAGTASLADAAGFPLGSLPGPPVLWHTGQGGEIARGYYGPGRGTGRRASRGELVDQLYAAFTGRRRGRADLLNPTGARLVREHLHAFVQAQLDAEAQPRDVPDLFYLLRRMATWAAPSHGAVEPVKDATAPLWSRRLLAHELGASTGERGREVFALRVLERLAPQLVDLPFADRRPWPTRQRRLGLEARRARTLATKVVAELGRRGRATRPAADDAAATFVPVHALVRERVLAQPDHPAWAVLDRARVERLLAAPPAALGTMSRYYVWRLAGVFLPAAYAAASIDPDRSVAPPAADVRHH